MLSGPKWEKNWKNSGFQPSPEKGIIAEQVENGPDTLFSSHCSNFSAMFSHFLGQVETYIFPGWRPETCPVASQPGVNAES